MFKVDQYEKLKMDSIEDIRDIFAKIVNLIIWVQKIVILNL